MIGTFGPVVFEASSARLRNFAEFARKSLAAFAEHQVLDNKPRLQHVGTGLDEILFTMKFISALHVDPQVEINVLRGMQRAGDARPLILGKWQVVDNKGRLRSALVNVTLREFAS